MAVRMAVHFPTLPTMARSRIAPTPTLVALGSTCTKSDNDNNEVTPCNNGSPQLKVGLTTSLVCIPFPILISIEVRVDLTFAVLNPIDGSIERVPIGGPRFRIQVQATYQDLFIPVPILTARVLEVDFAFMAPHPMDQAIIRHFMCSIERRPVAHRHSISGKTTSVTLLNGMSSPHLCLDEFLTLNSPSPATSGSIRPASEVNSSPKRSNRSITQRSNMSSMTSLQSPRGTNSEESEPPKRPPLPAWLPMFIA
mmetsp:Transcript_33457/g.80886  ORF Transcript_33457/g.80886 Transcript_33457/m.80886 type:complete len:253 (+) Transcript_33457:124-882(+)